MKLILKSKEHLTDNIWAFRFQYPAQLSPWVPGQFMYVEIPHDNPDDEGTKRWFTVSSAPYEQHYQITTRVSDSTFKQALAAVPIGGTIDLIDPPDGDFVWEETDRPRIFIAGGIGVTPYYSILKQRFHDHLPLDVELIYGGRTPDLPFRQEFEEWAAADPRLKIHYVIGERLTPEKLVALNPKLPASLVYLSGPEPLVESLGDQLKAGVVPAEQLKQDFFPNYTEANY
ncbi:MAG: flavodoxin reductase (ferredoxin-NADPH reductase) family 1 [Candidatus Saccharibacteria bacterium]|jgi:ferredoxin-NADP reductase|nr:flavodoxin reductase (ferredoxin-NADPH reductase) family 1 [Candidatus Saccharibacteria bacterium]